MKTLTFLFFLTTTVFGQTVDLKVNGGKISIYSDAVAHFIDKQTGKDNVKFDTLYILRTSGENGILPDNTFKKQTATTTIVLADTAEISRLLEHRKSLIALNLFAEQNSKDYIAVLIFPFNVVKEGFKSKYLPLQAWDSEYNYSNSQKEFVFDKLTLHKYHTD